MCFLVKKHSLDSPVCLAPHLGRLCCPAAKCTQAQVRQLNEEITATIHNHTHAKHWLHLDGPFWDKCWPSPCGDWDDAGYSPYSIDVADGLLPESWVQGSLKPGVKRILADTNYTSADIWLMTDVPNCQIPGAPRCSTGSMPGDDALWFQWFDELGLQSWSVWEFVTGGTQELNEYGDANANGTLTAKGIRRCQRAAVGDVSRLALCRP